MSEITVLDWKLVRLTLDQVGPFQEQITSFNFIDVLAPAEAQARPANLYMLLAKNGYGKTTVLECIHGLFGLLADPPLGRFANPDAAGRLQADFLVSWRRDRQEETVLLSMWTGTPDPLYTPGDVRLEGLSGDARWERICLGRSASGPTVLDGTSDDGLQLFRQVRDQAGQAPTSLLGASQMLPTVLFFPADRRVVAPTGAHAVERPHNWGYQPAQTFQSDGPEWRDSIDNLLVWLDWLGDGRLDDLLAYVNPLLFATDRKSLEKPQRETLTSYVKTPNGLHPLSGLSHGERALLQLFVRVACHMTRNTIILIDEIEAHLHSKWMNRMFQALKSLVRNDPRLSVIFTTHSRELIEVFDHTLAEEGIAKGGYLIEDEIA